MSSPRNMSNSGGNARVKPSMTITRERVDALEILVGQLNGVHAELSALSKKSPSDAVNKFKLKLVNSILKTANSLLGLEYKAVADFDVFDTDVVPSNSDVTFVIALYMEAVEKFRCDHIKGDLGYWFYNL